MIFFGFCWSHFKVYIHLPCINTQRPTKAPFSKTLHQGSGNNFDWDHNSDIICLIQISQVVQYCNEWVLDIVLDLNIFFFSITSSDIILRSALIQFWLLRASYFYTSTGQRLYIIFSEPAFCLCDIHCHEWVNYMENMKAWF